MLFLRKLHKWLGLIFGVQLVLWAASGIVFAWLQRADVAGEASLRPVESAALAPGTVTSEPSTWLHEYRDQDLFDVRLTSLSSRWLWRVELQDRVELRSIEDGTRLELDASWIRPHALARYAGEGTLTDLALLPEPGIEARSHQPAWRAQFDDAQRTTLYFAADDGRFLAARNSAWRIYDFFWMLHTMDYVGRDDFNNPLIVLSGTAALWLSISGMLLLITSFRRR